MQQTPNTPASHSAVPADLQQRLRATADAILRSLEAIELPKTFAQAAAAARAVMAVSRLMDQLYAPPKGVSKSASKMPPARSTPVMVSASEPEPDPAPEAIPFVNRKMRRRAEATLRRTG